MASIATALGINTGLDVTALVTGLTQASRAPKEAAIARRESANTAQISTVASLKSAIERFATSLDTLATGGSLRTQPVVSDSQILAATGSGGEITGFTGQLEVLALATGQSLVSTPVDTAAPLGAGTLTLSNGVTVTTDDDDTLADLAAKLTAAGKEQGLSASVIREGDNARLVIRGAAGAANAFTIEGDGALDRFAYSGSDGDMARAQAAGDARLKLDGIDVTRPSNTVIDLFGGVTLTLKRAVPGAPVALTTERPVAAIKQAVYDFASAYNTLEAALDAASAGGVDGEAAGPMRGSQVIREMRAQLARVAGSALREGDGPRSLSDIGVKTLRDGSLSVDAKALDAAMLRDPAAIEAMFVAADRTTPGFQGVAEAIETVRDSLTADKGVLTLADVRLKAEARAIALARETMERREDAYAAQLKETYGRLEAQLAAFAGTKTYLSQQIEIWTNAKN